MERNKEHLNPIPPSPGFTWRRIITIAGLVVLGITPWVQAQQAPPDLPAFCPPLTSIATPTLFDMLFGTTPIRFPFQ
ncbi:MAG: hypothetical protein ACE5EQ_06735 [Phycisphaerae bacterium]